MTTMSYFRGRSPVWRDLPIDLLSRSPIARWAPVPLRLIVGYGFEQIGLHRISLEVYAFNPRARHVYEKTGFVAEGVLRESLYYGGEWVDATVMSILDHEWARHHGYPSQP